MEQPLIRLNKNGEETESEEESTAEFTVEEVIESMKWSRFQLLLLFVSGIFTTAEAFEVMLLTVLFPAIQCEWQLSSLESAMLSVLVFTGMLFGSPVWGVLSDKYGRKPITYVASTLVTCIGFLCAFSPNLISLFVLRFFVGVAISGNIQMSVLMIEYIGSKYRAVTIVASQGFWAIGALSEVLLAWLIIPTIGWRYLVGISSLPIALALFTWPVVPESVRFLLVSGQKEKAMKTLGKATQMGRCSLPPGVLRDEVVEERGRVADLFHRDNRRTTLQLIVIWVTSISCYYGTSLATTQLLSINYCAAPLNVTVPLDTNNSTGSGCSPLSSSDYGQVAVTSVAELFIMPIVIVLADCIGRRNSMTLCQVLVVISYLLLLTCLGSTWGVTVLLFIARGFSAGITTIIYLYTPEVYPTQCRAIGLSCCYFAGRIGAMLTPMFSQVLMRASVHSALALYAGMSVLGTIATIFLPIETKGRRMK